MKLVLVLIFIIYFQSNGIEKQITYPIKINDIVNYEGKFYTTDTSSKFIIIKNNWLENQTSIYHYNETEKYNTTLLDHSEILDLIRNEDKVIALIYSKNRVFIANINSDYSINNVVLIDSVSYRREKYNLHYLDSIGNLIYSKYSNLYIYDHQQGAKTLISSDFVSGTFLHSNSKQLMFIEKQGEVAVLNSYEDKEKNLLLRLNLSDKYIIENKDDNILIYQQYFNNSSISIYNSELSLIKTIWLKGDINTINININEKTYVKVEFNGNSYLLQEFDFNNQLLRETKLNNELIGPLRLRKLEDFYVLILKNGICIFDEKLSILNISLYPINEKIKELSHLFTYLDNLILSSEKSTLMISYEKNPLWALYKGLELFFQYFIFLILIIIGLIFYKKYKDVKKENDYLLNISDNEFMYIFDKKGNLLKANKLAREILQIDTTIPLGRFFQFYCVLDHTEVIFHLMEKGIKLSEEFKQKIHIVIGDRVYNFLCNFYVNRDVSGKIRNYILQGVDITQELEQQRITNMAQLAHDMQTNLSTLKLITEQMTLSDNQNLSKRNKILKQVNLIINKVRDVVTVGRSSEIHKEEVSSKEIYFDLMQEFDESILEEIEIIEECQEFKIKCDKRKMLRALRNAMENSIKALKDRESRKITVSITKLGKYAYFSIEDNGVGMDNEIVQKMLRPYFTGSHGTGIGTMIMKNAIEQHGGEIVVESIKGEGTKLTFKIPV